MLGTEGEGDGTHIDGSYIYMWVGWGGLIACVLAGRYPSPIGFRSHFFVFLESLE